MFCAQDTCLRFCDTSPEKLDKSSGHSVAHVLGVAAIYIICVTYVCLNLDVAWLQMTAFAARLALDCHRVQAGYVDCVPCVQVSEQHLHGNAAQAADRSDHDSLAAPGIESMTSQIEIPTRPQSYTADQATSKHDVNQSRAERANESPSIAPPDDEALSGANGVGRQHGPASVAPPDDEALSAANGSDSQHGPAPRKVYGVSPALHSYMRRVHAPLLSKPLVKLLVVAVFVGGAVLSLAAIPHVSRYEHHAWCCLHKKGHMIKSSNPTLCI